MHPLRTIAPLILALTAGAAQAAPVHIHQGDLEGQSQGGVTRYLGIPYAAAPVGESRWRPPQPAPRWRGALHADRFGANCQQAQAPKAFRAWTSEYLIEGPSAAIRSR
jgi:para-nitrobenzyl esterase